MDIYSPEQIEEAKNNSTLDLELLRSQTHLNIIEHLDVNKKFNIIRTSEGLGKSSLVLKYKEKFKSERIIVVCKSYTQLKGKWKLYHKLFPDLKIEILPGNVVFLDSYNIDKSDYVLKTNDDGERFVSLYETLIGAGSISDNDRKLALKEFHKYENIKKGKTKVDIILMTEKKLEVELMSMKNFRDSKELIIFDEYHQDTWGIYKSVEWEQKSNRHWNKKYGNKIFKTETWPNFYTEMYKELKDFKKYIEGHVIILTTELIPLMNMFHIYGETQVNAVNGTNIFLTDNRVRIQVVNRNIINSKNKKQFAEQWKSKGYIVMGNGIGSDKNHTTILGQNYHDEWNSETKLALILNQPNPAEVSVIKENTDLDNINNMSVIRMADILNQYLGRCCGYRHNVKFKEFLIFIPNNFVYNVVNYLRYICEVEEI